jgi:hypothetical protein
MNPMPPPIDVTAARMKLLSPRHRIAHLRALISGLPDGSVRRDQLAVLLRDAMTAPPANENRAP